MNLTDEQWDTLVEATERSLMEDAWFNSDFLRTLVLHYMGDMSESEMCAVLADFYADDYEKRLTEVLGFNPYDTENTNV